MKQHITQKQLNELSLKGKSNLMKWLNTRDSELTEDDSDDAYAQEAFLSIGQMIEFLWDKEKVDDMFDEPVVNLPTYMDSWVNAEQFCDDLWEEVREGFEE